jgi:two-component system chemotaxis response regulator CheB
VSEPIRVLVVDDSVVVRLVVAEALHADPELALAGVAPDGEAALEKIAQLQPDVVVLDVEMPKLDGLATLRAIRARDRRLPVVMFSTLTARGASTTLDALTLGASDYVQKPSTGNREASVQVLREELLPKLRALGQRVRRPPAAPVPLARRASPSSRLDVVVIGVSTGGPNALAEVLPALPADLPVPVLLVQHMPPLFTGLLAERLHKLSGLDVAEAAGGELVGPGQVWVAQGGSHLVVEPSPEGPRLAMSDAAPVNSCRPAVDVLFSSAAATFGPRVLAVVMTGMGQDGFAGCRAVKEAGGQVVVQDADTSVVWGMPRFVAEAGLAEAVLPLGALADEITRRASAGRRSPLTTGPQQRA